MGDIIEVKLPSGPDSLFVNGRKVRLEDSLAVRSKSPSGFAWGYAGSGPSQTALAILVAVLGKRNADYLWPGGDAERLFQMFKEEHVATWDQNACVIVELDVERWADEALAYQRTLP